MSWVFNVLEDGIDRSLDNVSHLVLQVGLLEVLNLIEHGEGSVVEGSLSVQLTVGEEVDESSLLDKLILLIYSSVLDLLLRVSKMLTLSHLDIIGPLTSHLLELILGVDVVEDCEFWSNNIGKVTELNVTEVERNEELVMPDHRSEPVVVTPSSHSGDGDDGSNIQTEENYSSS